MSLDNLIRDYARQDLQRFCPQAHYLRRDHSPTADRELAEPLLREPVRFGLTPRERVAADALSALAIYEIRSRAIWTEAFPARDLDDVTAAKPLSLNQEREIYGRREAFRRFALVYARVLNDVQLIEYYQCETPMPGARDERGAAEEKKAPDAKSSMSCSKRKAAILKDLGGDYKNLESAFRRPEQWIVDCRDQEKGTGWYYADLIENGCVERWGDRVQKHGQHASLPAPKPWGMKDGKKV